MFTVASVDQPGRQGQMNILQLDHITEKDIVIGETSDILSHLDVPEQECPDLVINNASERSTNAETVPRFAQLTDEEIDQIQLARQSHNTKSNTKWGVRVFRGRFSSRLNQFCFIYCRENVTPCPYNNY